MVYAGLTWKLVSETKQLRRVQTDPRISMHVEPSRMAERGRVELVIQNVGQGPAKEISFGFEGDGTYFGNGPIDQLNVIKNGLRNLAPHQEFRVILGWLNIGGTFERAKQNPWIFDVRYKSISESEACEQFVIDFSQFENLIAGVQAPEVRIAESIEKIERKIQDIAQ